MTKPKHRIELRFWNETDLRRWFAPAAFGAVALASRPIRTWRWRTCWAVENILPPECGRPRLIALVRDEAAARQLMAEIVAAIGAEQRREAGALDRAGDPDHLGEIEEQTSAARAARQPPPE